MKKTETGISIEPATSVCHILSKPIKHWFSVIALILFFMALCAVVFTD